MKLSRFFNSLKIVSMVTIAWLAVEALAFGQRAQFPDFFEVQPSTGFSQPAAIQAPFGSGVNQGVPPSITLQPPPGTLVNPQQAPTITGPPFDPYNLNSTPLPSLPGSTPIPNYGTNFNSPPPGYNFSSPPPSMNFGYTGASPNVMQPNVSGYNFGNTNRPFSNNAGAWPSQTWSNLRDKWWPRLIEHPRFRHLWISGNNGNELGLNEAELATTLTWPNFLGSSQALLISPGMAVEFWSGPDTMLTGFDMPAITYSPYLSIEGGSDTRRNVGLETNLTLGVYSDFRNVNSDSLRIMGTGLGWVRVNSYTTFKVGVEYLDRVKVKMLPAFGFFMQPNSEMKVDLYFPRPRVSHRLPRMGNYEVWGYVAGEYGGGSWTIERIGNVDDQVDVNEVRAMLGFEWVGPRQVTGFLETGYVFDRELLYRSDPLDRLSLQDAWMVRGGFSF